MGTIRHNDPMPFHPPLGSCSGARKSIPMRCRHVSTFLLFSVLLLLLTGAPAISAAPILTSAAFATPQFEQVWERADRPVAEAGAGRSWLWGPHPGETRTEPFADAPGGTRTVQY